MGPRLFTSLLNFCIDNKEETLACVIVAYYNILISEKMICKCLKNDFLHLLKFIWCFGKNYFEDETTAKTFISYTDLIKLSRVMYKEKFEGQDVEELVVRFCQSITKWYVITDDNIIIALLKEGQDELALEIMGYYAQDINKELFLYCMTFGNEIFMKEALKKSAFDLMIFKEEIVIN